MAQLRRSPLDARSRQLGATMTPFAGWEMPLDYGSVVAEHRAVREAAGVFDLSHLGTLAVTGDDAEACVQRAFTNDAAGLPVGRAHYTLCLTPDGGILDDLLVYRLPEAMLVVPNASNTSAVHAVLDECSRGLAARVADVKDDLAILAVQGATSAAVLTGAGIDVAGMSYLDCRLLPGATRLEGGVLARSGYTGERGYEVFAPAADAPQLWDRIVAAGAVPVGLGARDTLRLEMGYPLHGNDITSDTSPVEARLGWAVKVSTEFIGKDAYLKAKEAGPRRLLWGLRVTGRGIPRAHCGVLLRGEPVGETTSGTFSPTLRAGIAMAYLRAGVAEHDEVAVDVRGKHLPAQVVRPPFVPARTKDADG